MSTVHKSLIENKETRTVSSNYVKEIEIMSERESLLSNVRSNNINTVSLKSNITSVAAPGDRERSRSEFTTENEKVHRSTL